MSAEHVAPYPYRCPSDAGEHAFKRMAAKEWEPQTMAVWCTRCGGMVRVPADGPIQPLDDMTDDELDAIERRLLGMGR